MRKPTQILRATLTQELTVVLQPESDAAPDAVRQVRVLTQGELAMFCLDQLPEIIGQNRTYKVPEFPPNSAIPFTMGADQFLVGASAEGLTYCTVIIEYV